MTDNILQTLQQLIQDVIAPDLRELKVKVASLEQQHETHYEALTKQLDSMSKQNEVQFKALLSAIGEAKAQSELANFKSIADLRERVAVLESTKH